MSLFKQLDNCKMADKHLLIVEAMVDNEILFIEEGELVYQLFLHGYEKIMLFVKTQTLQVKQGKKLETKKVSWEEVVQFMM